jgi:hypothetical protein
MGRGAALESVGRIAHLPSEERQRLPCSSLAPGQIRQSRDTPYRGAPFRSFGCAYPPSL